MSSITYFLKVNQCIITDFNYLLYNYIYYIIISKYLLLVSNNTHTY